MKFLLNLKLRTRFLLIPLVAAAGLALLGVIFLNILNTQKILLSHVVSQDLVKIDNLSTLFSKLSTNHVQIFDLLASAGSDPGIDAERLYELGKNNLFLIHKITSDVKETAEHLFLSEEEQAIYNGLAKELIRYRDASVIAIDMASVDPTLARQHMITANRNYSDVNNSFLLLLDQARQHGNTSIANVLRAFDRRAVQFGFLLVFAIGSVVAITVSLSDLLSRELRSMIGAIARLAEGDRDVEIPHVLRQDEVGTIAHAIGIFKQKLIQLSESEAKAVRHLDQIRALQEIDQAITSTLNLHDVLRVLLEKIDLLLPYSAATVRLLNDESGLLEPVACRNLDETEWKAGQWKGGRGIPNAVFETKRPIFISDVCSDHRVKDPAFFRKHNLVFYMGVPLLIRGEPFGVLSFYTKEEHGFSDEEAEFLIALAGQAAVAIHNSQLYEEMKDLAADLSRSNNVKDEFLSVMSHELRTPLNVVLGYAAMIKDGLLGNVSPEQAEALGKIVSRAKDQLAMISGILQATRMEAERANAEKKEFSLRDFLDDLRATYEVPLDKDLAILWSYSRNVPAITSDRDKIKHVLQNLINNAIKFTEKGSVAISVRVVDVEDPIAPSAPAADASSGHNGEPRSLKAGNRMRWAEFKVTDTGIGIPGNALPYIFEKFHQGDSSETRAYGGVGLGLYIVKEYTELLGGSIEVESKPAGGSTFTVRIPCGSDQPSVCVQETSTEGLATPILL